MKRELGLTEETFLIANIGQICLRKGQDVAATAIARLVTQFPDLHLLFVGERHSQKSESIEYEQSLREPFLQAGIEDHLHFTGFRMEINRILNEIDLLVHTAHQEPLGRVLLESAASGCPIVATTAGGTREILGHNLSGILLPPGDVDLLEYTLAELIPDAYRQTQLGQEALHQMEQKFSISDSAAGLRAIWERLL
ncbi:MAG: glycosyltransferase family 4 protein [Planctomycetaceae bacterium]